MTHPAHPTDVEPSWRPPAYSGYDRHPAIDLPEAGLVRSGAQAWTHLRELAIERSHNRATTPELIVLDTYPGTELADLLAEVRAMWPDVDIIDVEECALPIEQIDAIIAHNVTDDRIFGVLSNHRLREFYDADALAALGAQLATRTKPTVVAGWGAALVDCEPDLLVLVDLARWEIQRRQRAGGTNWRCDNSTEDRLRKYKRGFFVEWRVADRHKTAIFPRVDAIVQTGPSGCASDDGGTKEIDATDLWAAFDQAVRGPMRVVPFFDPGVWGGQWMKEVCDLDKDAMNYAWCFDCVPEENSLEIASGGVRIEIPAIDLVLTRPQELLGPRVVARFGAEFPIRFDLLDTMGGQNLSLQVHPTSDYIRQTFGLSYTQDESYYMLDAADDAHVYLGTRSDIDPEKMMRTLEEAGEGLYSFPAEDYVNIIPTKKHDHFLIPGGTIHASGRNSLVLEISATPNWFTFKLWDWDRVDLDGKPRPINLDHGRNVIAWERDTDWTMDEAVNVIEPITEGEGWSEERTGLHELEFIEVRRHWFTGPVPHDTRGTVNVLNLVEGVEATVSSPSGAFDPYVVHYAETFIVPAAVGEYVITPSGAAVGTQCATVKASVRGTAVGVRSIDA